MTSGKWKAAVALLVGLGVLVSLGCQANTEPIERAANTALDTIVKPAVEKAAAELSTRTAALQGQGSLINPGYVIEGFGNFGPGVAYRISIRAEGISGNIAGHSQADQGQATTDERPPGERTPAEPTRPPEP